MHGTARDADLLKQLAGVSTRGRKLDKPVYHYSLSWAPGERPSADDKLAARASLRAVGMEDRQALVIEHTDRKHQHVHVVVNRVSAEDGRAASVSHDARALSTWARTWEREHGGIRCPWRRATGLERVAQVIRREPPPPPAVLRRGPGRRWRSEPERREWAALYGRGAGREERRELARAHRQTRARPDPEPSRPRPTDGVTLTPDSYAAAKVIERQLPHVDGVLAVSDRTLDKLAAYADRYLNETARSVVADLQLRVVADRDRAAREHAEEVYHRPAVDREADRLRQAHTRAWRVGHAATPEPPPRRKALESVMHAVVERFWSLIEAVCREVQSRLRDRDRERRKREWARGPERDLGRESGRDRGGSRDR